MSIRLLRNAIATATVVGAFVVAVEGQSSGEFFNEGWESGSLAATFNSSSFGRLTDSDQFQLDSVIAGRTGAAALRHRLVAGMPVDSVDSVTQHFGDARTTPVHASGAGQHFYDIYLHYRVAYSPGFDFGTGHFKQFIFGTQDERRHDETCCVPFAAHYLTTLVERGGVLQAEAYNKQSGGPRFDLNPNTGGYSDANPFRVQSGRWYTMEVRRRLNDAGVDNGVFQMWVDGQLVADYTSVRFRVPPSGSYGSNFTYGTNFLMLTDYTTTVVSRNQDVYYDDVRMGTSRTGVVPPTPPTPQLPAAPRNLRIIPGPSSAFMEQ